MSSRTLTRAPSPAALAALGSALANFRISTTFAPAIGNIASKRHASHQAQGRANKAKQGPGKRLGAKKQAGEYVVTGNILFKQRGTHWFPGENCFMGRDHTIHAGTPGYVTYYRDPARHPDRKYIGIVFERTQTLPVSPLAPRRRRLGMLAYQMPSSADPSETAQSETTEGDAIMDEAKDSAGLAILEPTYKRTSYQNRPANWEIGLAAERSAAARNVTPFKPRDRFTAWRKATVRKEKNAERRSMRRGGKKK